MTCLAPAQVWVTAALGMLAVSLPPGIACRNE